MILMSRVFCWNQAEEWYSVWIISVHRL